MAVPNVPGWNVLRLLSDRDVGLSRRVHAPGLGMYMSMIHVSGGAGPGAIKIVYATPNTACFGVSASTTGGVVGVYGMAKWESYPVSWILNGTNIPVGTFASAGAYFQAILTCQTLAPAGNRISALSVPSPRTPPPPPSRPRLLP